MLDLMRNAGKHIVAALMAGLLLRFWFIHYYPVVDGDSLVYGEIARNWFWHGVYGFTVHGSIRPTLIRLPGYPLFLGVGFFLFGIDHYLRILWLQAAIDLGTCLLVAGFAAKTISRRAGIVTLYLAALCPFTANFVASPLTETPTLFCIAIGLYALASYVEQPGFNRWVWILAISISYATLLRPDGALLGIVLIPAMFWYTRKQISTSQGGRQAVLCAVIAIVPFIAWTVRNLHTMQVFQPLVPRYATDPGEFVPYGWIKWVRTWAVDFASTEEIYWSVNGSPLDITALPVRACDTPAQKAETAQLFSDYNRTYVMTPVMSEQFGLLAQQRIADRPIRYYVGLPLARLADMWLRPRVSQLWIELRWWQYRRHPSETIFSWGYAALNLGYLLLAVWGLKKRVPFTGVMIAYVAIRCLLLLTLEAPESRYTLECYPIILILAGAALASRKRLTSELPGSLDRS